MASTTLWCLWCIQTLLKPIFIQYNVDVVVNGDVKQQTIQTTQNDSAISQSSLNLISIYKTARSSVDYNNLDDKKPKKVCQWQKKQRRSFNTIKTGLINAKRSRQKVRFLTLTTSDIQKDNIKYDDHKLNDSFRKLKQRTKRLTVAKLIQQGYLKSSAVRTYYQSKPMTEVFDFDYFKVTTNEGNGVIHCLYKGEYLPYNWIVDNWQDLHNSWDINIKLIKTSRKDVNNTSAYVVSQYLGSQGSSYQRSSQSWNWLFRGYRTAWLEFLASCKISYYYNPIKNTYYQNKTEVDIFKVWEDKVYSITRELYEKGPLLVQHQLDGQILNQ